ncbi:hypothetical protein DTL21_17365 [Bremerella cremea]|uniref:Uncharacterized protein n=1 Tax=Blastopirellula marina TaxID=124 RepID=A0A2S8FIK0_9BACT|nr:hypothetical protein C5Y83_17350 [Blastopirellula marina]RCS45082.1 hypothetical protein DTL21_17365 [Bremerella cremea]
MRIRPPAKENDNRRSAGSHLRASPLIDRRPSRKLKARNSCSIDGRMTVQRSLGVPGDFVERMFDEPGRIHSPEVNG